MFESLRKSLARQIIQRISPVTTNEEEPEKHAPFY